MNNDLQVKVGAKEFGWGVLVCYERKVQESKLNPNDAKTTYLLQMLLNFAPFDDKRLADFAADAQPARAGQRSRPEVIFYHID